MIPYGTKANQYEIDRAMQKAGHYTGIWSIAMQDKAMIEGMTRTVDRSLEHLGSSDIAVIAARRRLIKLARDLEHGIEPWRQPSGAVPRAPARPGLVRAGVRRAARTARGGCARTRRGGRRALTSPRKPLGGAPRRAPPQVDFTNMRASGFRVPDTRSLWAIPRGKRKRG